MSSIEWYYARGDQQSGPVSPQELKRMASAGEIAPEDLVWREGMDDWSPARTVRGLFDDAARSTVGGRASAKPAEASAEPAMTVIPSPPPLAETSAAPFATIATMEESAAAGPSPHVFDRALDGLRAMFPAAFVDAAAGIFGSAGRLSLYLAIAAVAIFAVLVGVKSQQLGPVLTGATQVLILAVLQYAAGRFLDSLDRVIRGTSGRVSSTVFPDSFALLSIAVGLALLLETALAGLQRGQYWTIVGGLVSFIVCEFMAVVSLNLRALSINVSPQVPAGDEAIGLLLFLLKAGLRLTPVAFGAGVVWATILMCYACYVAYNAGPAAAQAVSETGARLAFYFAALPPAAYLVFLVCQLFVDVIRAVLAIPGVVDRAEAKKDELR